jgi:hypothetical protein
MAIRATESGVTYKNKIKAIKKWNAGKRFIIKMSRHLLKKNDNDNMSYKEPCAGK